MISMAWTGAFMWCIPILGWRYFVNNGKKLQPGNITSYIVTLSTNIFIQQRFQIPISSLFSIFFSDNVCDTEFASDMTFKVVTSIFNFYIPTACMVGLNAKIFLAIKRRSKDIEQFGAYSASGAVSAKPAERQPKNLTKTSPHSALKSTCGIRSSKELPMTNIAEAMVRAASLGKRCSLRRPKQQKSASPSR